MSCFIRETKSIRCVVSNKRGMMLTLGTRNPIPSIERDISARYVYFNFRLHTGSISPLAQEFTKRVPLICHAN